MISFDDPQQRFVLLLAAGAAFQVVLDERHKGGGVIAAGGALAELVDQLVHTVTVKVVFLGFGSQGCQASRVVRVHLGVASQPPPESAC
jgi:hypothetical protein